ncbi:MAG: hypothetical protein RRX95_01855 [Oscillospiraceae bacterium]
MLNDKYKSELDRIKADDDFKQRTIKMLEEKQSQLKNSGNEIIFDTSAPKGKTIKFKSVLSVAACVAFMLVGFAFYGKDVFFPKLPLEPETAPTYSKADATPLAPSNKKADSERIISEFSTGSGMGFEGLLAYDISDLENGNPYGADMIFRTLPVFYHSVADAQNLQKICSDSAKKINKEITSFQYSYVTLVYENGQVSTHKNYDTPSPAPLAPSDILYSVTANFDGGYMRVQASSGSLSIFFNPALSVDGIACTHDNNNRETVLSNTQVYNEKFKKFVDMKNPTCEAMGDFTFKGDRLWNSYVYEKSDDPAQAIFNFCINPVQFIQNEEEELWVLRRCVSDDKKVADLPAITSSQALWKLYQGEYLTTVPYPITDDTLVSKIELVYRLPAFDEREMKYEGYILPLYKFYVELPQMAMENGLKSYGIYYVNAIDENYVEYTVKDIQFN